MKTLNEVVDKLEELKDSGYGKITVYLKDTYGYHLNVKEIHIDDEGDIVIVGDY